MIQKSKRDECVFQNQLIYTMHGRPLCLIDGKNLKSEDAFVMVPRGHCFKTGPYAKVFNEFLRAKKACENENQKNSIHDKQRSKSISSLKNEKVTKNRIKSLDRNKSCTCNNRKYNDIFVEGRGPKIQREQSQTRRKKSTGCCFCCSSKSKSRDGSADGTYSKSKYKKCQHCGHDIKGLRL